MLACRLDELAGRATHLVPIPSRFTIPQDIVDRRQGFDICIASSILIR